MSAKKEKKIQLQAQEYERQALHHFERNEFLEAVQSYSRYLALKKTSVAYATRAMAHLNLNSPKEALEDAVSALGVDAKNPKGNLVKALSLIGMQKYEDSLPFLVKCLKYDPENVEALRQYKLVNEKLESKEELDDKLLVAVSCNANEVQLKLEKPDTKDPEGMVLQMGKIDSVSSDEYVSFEKSADELMEAEGTKVPSRLKSLELLTSEEAGLVQTTDECQNESYKSLSALECAGAEDATHPVSYTFEVRDDTPVKCSPSFPQETQEVGPSSEGKEVEDASLPTLPFLETLDAPVMEFAEKNLDAALDDESAKDSLSILLASSSVESHSVSCHSCGFKVPDASLVECFLSSTQETQEVDLGSEGKEVKNASLPTSSILENFDTCIMECPEKDLNASLDEENAKAAFPILLASSSVEPHAVEITEIHMPQFLEKTPVKEDAQAVLNGGEERSASFSVDLMGMDPEMVSEDKEGRNASLEAVVSEIPLFSPKFVVFDEMVTVAETRKSNGVFSVRVDTETKPVEVSEEVVTVTELKKVKQEVLETESSDFIGVLKQDPAVSKRDSAFKVAGAKLTTVEPTASHERFKFTHFTAATDPTLSFSLVDAAGNTTISKSWSEVVAILKDCHQPIGRILLQCITLDKQALEFFRSLDPVCFSGIEICFNRIDFSNVRGSFTEIFEKVVKPKMVQFGGIKGVNSVLLCKALNTYLGLRDASVVHFFDFTDFVSPIKIEAEAIISFLHHYGSTEKRMITLIRSHLAVGMEELLGKMTKKFTGDSRKCSFSLLVEFPDDKKRLPEERLVENKVTGEQMKVKVRQPASVDVHLFGPGTLRVVEPRFIVEVVRSSLEETENFA